MKMNGPIVTAGAVIALVGLVGLAAAQDHQGAPSTPAPASGPAAATPAPQTPSSGPPSSSSAPAASAAVPAPPSAAAKATPVPSATAPTTPPAQTAAKLTPPQLDQLLAPIALYPDQLLDQVLMASTYPLEVVEAARWLDVPANRQLRGDALMAALKSKNWDPSVMALVPFPGLLTTMSDKVDWTQQLGNAFLAQQSDVIAEIQHLRQEAMAAGNLNDAKCHCTVSQNGGNISIAAANPSAVDVPICNPRVAYGSWAYADYPPDELPLPYGYAWGPEPYIGFYPFVNVAFYGPLWGWASFDWGRRDILIDRAIYNRFGFRGPILAGNVWVHDPAHRRGVAYADAAVASHFGGRVVGERAGLPHGGSGGTIAPPRVEAAHEAGPHGGVAREEPRGPEVFHGASRAEAATHVEHAGPHEAFRGGARSASVFHGAPHAAAAFHGGFHGGGPRAVAHAPSPHFGGGGMHAAVFHGGGGPHIAAAPHGGGGAPHGGGGGAPHGGGGGHDGHH
jgi:Protein of unknown function (DUF3300)